MDKETKSSIDISTKELVSKGAVVLRRGAGGGMGCCTALEGK